MPLRSLLPALLALLLAAPAAASAEPVPNPVVNGPIAGGVRGYPQNHTIYPLTGPGFDYREDEYFFSGSATDRSNGRTADYKSRMLVRLPRDPARFNGIVLVDWMNVTDGEDFEFTWWPSAHDYLMRQGYGYVALTAQQVGVNHLRAWDPERYATLVHPGDDYSFDIYAQAIQALRDPAHNATSPLYPRKTDPMNGLEVRHVVAGGVSQSAGRLAGFINGGYNRGIVDAYNIERAIGDTYKDFSTFIFELDEETSFYGGGAAPRVADNPHYTVWEEAGAAHETRTWWDYRWTTQQRDELASDTPDPVNAACGVNEGRIDYSVRAMLFWTQLYLETGQRPPSAPRVQRVSAADNAPARDADGLAIGGLRHAYVQVPIAVNRGDGCPFWGTYEPWSDEQIRARYATHADYLRKVTAWADHEVAQGWLLPEDRDDTIAQARAFDQPWPGEALPPGTAGGNGSGTGSGSSGQNGRAVSRGCLPRRPGLRARAIGAVALGSTIRQLLVRAGSPTRVTKQAVRWCVTGGGTVTAVLRRGRVALVASNVRGTRAAGVRVGGRGGRPGLHRRGRIVYRVRKGRVTFVAIARSPRGATALARRV